MKFLGTIDPVYEGVLTSQALASNSLADVNFCTFTVPANILTLGQQVMLEAWGNSDNGTTAGTLNFWIKVGATKICTVSFTTTTTAKTLQGWHVRILVTFRSVGSGGTMIGAGIYWSTAPTVTNGTTVNTSTTAVATNASLAITAGFNWTAANASNIARCDHARMDLL
jgi:hypothetical protein